MNADREVSSLVRRRSARRLPWHLWSWPLLAAGLLCGAGTAAAAELEVKCGLEGSNVWDDAGTGSAAPVTFYLAPPQNDFHPLGVTADSQPAGKTSTLCLVRDISKDRDALALPVDYKRRWWDRGSGARRDGAIWQPVCPLGYSAVGFMVQASYRKPAKDAIRCVRQGLTVLGVAKEPHVYKDIGTRAFQDLSVWRLEAVSPDEGFDVGAIFATDTRNRPTDKNGVRLLRKSEVRVVE